jgi:L-seryl-tRNA(Ser) seleniumtransferase
MSEIASGYSNLEYDLDLGKRGNRGTHLYELLNKLVGCEASLAVNNNAAAVFLILSTLAKKREVIVSRGELVQIGGGFRIPEIMKSSGAKLVEVGTTNKTSIADYRRSVGAKTALLLKVHQSNFQMAGFVESASVKELASLSKESGVPLAVDLGSGVLLNTEEFGFEHEPTPQEIIASGADVVSFSGDKLLGGPQAGIIVGKRRFVEQLAKDPLFRTLRLDKIVISGLERVLVQYLKGEAAEKIPIWSMVATSLDELKKRAGAVIRKVSNPGLRLEIGEGRSSTGGGSLPEATIPSVVIVLNSDLSPDEIASRMRAFKPPVLGRIEGDRFLIDLRTVLGGEDQILIEHLNAL